MKKHSARGGTRLPDRGHTLPGKPRIIISNHLEPYGKFL